MYANLTVKLRFLFNTVSLKDHITLSATAPDRNLAFFVLPKPERFGIL